MHTTFLWLLGYLSQNMISSTNTDYNLSLSWHHIFCCEFTSDYCGIEASLVLKWRMFLLKLLQVVNWVIKHLREIRIFWSKQRVGSQKVVQFLHAFRVFSWAFYVSLSVTVPITEAKYFLSPFFRIFFFSLVSSLRQGLFIQCLVQKAADFTSGFWGTIVIQMMRLILLGESPETGHFRSLI